MLRAVKRNGEAGEQGFVVGEAGAEWSKRCLGAAGIQAKATETKASRQEVWRKRVLAGGERCMYVS